MLSTSSTLNEYLLCERVDRLIKKRLLLFILAKKHRLSSQMKSSRKKINKRWCRKDNDSDVVSLYIYPKKNISEGIAIDIALRISHQNVRWHLVNPPTEENCTRWYQSVKLNIERQWEYRNSGCRTTKKRKKEIPSERILFPVSFS